MVETGAAARRQSCRCGWQSRWCPMNKRESRVKGGSRLSGDGARGQGPVRCSMVEGSTLVRSLRINRAMSSLHLQLWRGSEFSGNNNRGRTALQLQELPLIYTDIESGRCARFEVRGASRGRVVVEAGGSLVFVRGYGRTVWVVPYDPMGVLEARRCVLPAWAVLLTKNPKHPKPTRDRSMAVQRLSASLSVPRRRLSAVGPSGG